MTLLAWLATLAFAQNDCLSSDAHPVAGTSGYDNALAALRTNAVTYAATAFAERSVFPEREGVEQEGGAVAVYEFNNTFSAARVPMWSLAEDCPVDKRFATHPVDLVAGNLGFVFRYGRIGGYYASGVVLGAPSSRDTFQRGAGAVAGYPLITMYPLMFAPLLGNRMVVSGSSAWAVDSLGGIVIDATVVELRAGWTASSGAHLSVEDPLFGLFANAVITEGFSELPQFAAGVRRLGYGEGATDKVGRTSAYGRGLPLTEGGEDEDGERFSPQRLLTGHLEQQGIARRLDLAVAYAVAPVPAVHEARVALHSVDFHELDLPESSEGFSGKFLVQAGTVTLPPQWYYGQPGGTKLHLRGEAAMVLGRSRVELTLMRNDAEHLALYPFAVDSVHYRLSVRGEL